MAQTKQMTMNVEGEKITLKARRSGDGRGGVFYAIAVNGWKSRVLVRLNELEGSNMADQALWLALEKGLAKWLKARS
tara:strand:- start:6 stop:236 length:231 start_codon:yes stop_codon:yes gene_type:complete